MTSLTGWTAHEFEQALGVGDRQGGLACCSPWGRKESHTTERLNGTELTSFLFPFSKTVLKESRTFLFHLKSQALLEALLIYFSVVLFLLYSLWS